MWPLAILLKTDLFGNNKFVVVIIAVQGVPKSFILFVRNKVRPRKKRSLFPLSRPTLFLTADPNIFFLSKKRLMKVQLTAKYYLVS